MLVLSIGFTALAVRGQSQHTLPTLRARVLVENLLCNLFGGGEFRKDGPNAKNIHVQTSGHGPR